MDEQNLASGCRSELGDGDSSMGGGDKAGARKEVRRVGSVLGWLKVARRRNALGRRFGRAEEEHRGRKSDYGGSEDRLVERADEERLIVLGEGVSN